MTNRKIDEIMSDIMPEMQNNANQALANQAQIEQFKSLYYLFKGKRDTAIKLFTDNKHFRRRDIVELNESIYQKLRLLNLVTDTNSVIVSLSSKEIKSFGNWDEFINHNWNISPTTNYITIEWEFNIIFPNQISEVPQTHSLRVRIGNGLRPNEMLQVIFQGGEETDLQEAQSQVVCKIDFVNAQLCSELQMIVSDWYNALPSNTENHKLILFLLKYKNHIKSFISLLFLTASLIILNYLVSYFYKNNEILLNSILTSFYKISTLSVFVIFIAITFGKKLSEKIMNSSISKFSKNPMFEFTKGDENKLLETNKKNKKFLNKFFISIILAIASNVIAYGIGKLIPTIAEIIK